MPNKTQKDLDHHANQCNLNNKAHKEAQDNRANQLNPNNHRFQSKQPKKGA